ncbi:MAG: hypothetical protein N2691_01495 [Patescibacteria group bacterium]|nr:hypothetical protein [Patescibacteria group bacterium]
MKRTADVSRRNRMIRLIRNISGLVLTLLLAGGVAYSMYTQSREIKPQPVQILVARTAIPAQGSITAETIGLLTVSPDSVPPNALRKDEVSSIIGKKVVVGVAEGDILSPSLFGTSKQDLSAGIAGALESGFRVYYLSQQDVHQFPPDLRIGNVVDIYAVNIKGTDTLRAVALLSTVPVVDVLRGGENGSSGILFVGFRLTGAEVEAILPRQNGDWKYQIVLRAQQDAHAAKTPVDRSAETDSPSATSSGQRPR